MQHDLVRNVCFVPHKHSSPAVCACLSRGDGETDEQMTALLVAACTGLAVSKPVQDKLATSIPKFLNEQGGRSMVGLASTGVVAAIVFYFMKDYVIKP